RIRSPYLHLLSPAAPRLLNPNRHVRRAVGHVQGQALDPHPLPKSRAVNQRHRAHPAEVKRTRRIESPPRTGLAENLKIHPHGTPRIRKASQIMRPTWQNIRCNRQRSPNYKSSRTCHGNGVTAFRRSRDDGNPVTFVLVGRRPCCVSYRKDWIVIGRKQDRAAHPSAT